MLWSSNGTFPHTSTYSTTPKLHTSTSGPVYTFALSSSGAAKYSEPQNVDRCDEGLYKLERPKSIILIFPVCEISIFSILRSGNGCSERYGSNRKGLTSVDNVILVTVVESATNLSGELACYTFA